MKKIKRIVVKIGTKVLIAANGSIDRERVRDIACQVSEIKKSGIDVIMVTSGAIGSGLWLLGMKRRPADLATLQAAAAIGQNHLMHVYGECFRQFDINTAQILLTQEDFNDRSRYLNIKHTIEKVLGYGAVPIINENDTVAVDEIKCGDNDRLSSLVADLCRVDMLVLLTDVDGLLDGCGNVIGIVNDITVSITKLGGKSSSDLGTGGMATKLESAKSATRAGIECIIANGKKKGVLSGIILDGKPDGTVFVCGKEKLLARKRWIAFSSRPKGSIIVDDGAASALKDKNKSLLASGVMDLDGNFNAGAVVKILNRNKKEFARGITSYSSKDLAKIKGERSCDFKERLGYAGPDEIIHKDNLVIT